MIMDFFKIEFQKIIGLIIVIITPSHQATLPSADPITSTIHSPVTQTLNTGPIRHDQRAVDIFPPSKEQRVCMNKNGQTWTLLQCDYPKHQVIGLESISLGYLNSGTCLRNSSFDGCEQYHSPEMYTRDLDYMSGRLPVKRNLAIQMAYGNCNDGQSRTFGDYTVLRYDCVPDTSLTSMCRKFTRTGNILYISNHGYPENGSPDGNCSCIIKSASNNVSVQFYDNRIARGQFLKLTNADGSVLKSWTNENNFNHRQHYDLNIDSNSFYLNWDAGNVTSENGEGKFWIRIVASDKSKLSLECSERQTSKPFKIEKTDELLRSKKYVRQCKGASKESFLNPVCGGGQVIGLHHIRLGFLNGSQCHPSVGLNSCEQDHTKYQYLGTWNDTEDNGDLGKMSGRPANQHPMSTIGVSGECIPIGVNGTILFKDADYITANYDCVNRANITSMCTPSSRTGDVLYVWNYGYPNSGDVLERSCHCTIDSAATFFIVQTYDNRIDKRQLLDLSYGNDTIMLQWHGDENFNHIDTKTVETKHIGPLTLNWRSPNGTGVMLTQKKGLFWIRIKAHDESPLSIQCFEPVWPPTTTTTTTTPSTTTDRSTKNRGNATTTPVQNQNGSEICNTDACKESSQKTFCFKSTYVYGAGGGVAAILIVFIIGCIVMNTRKKVDKDSGSLVNNMDLTEMRSIKTSKETSHDYEDLMPGRGPDNYAYVRDVPRRSSRFSDTDLTEDEDTRSNYSRRSTGHRHRDREYSDDRRRGDRDRRRYRDDRRDRPDRRDRRGGSRDGDMERSSGEGRRYHKSGDHDERRERRDGRQKRRDRIEEEGSDVDSIAPPDKDHHRREDKRRKDKDGFISRKSSETINGDVSETGSPLQNGNTESKIKMVDQL